MLSWWSTRAGRRNIGHPRARRACRAPSCAMDRWMRRGKEGSRAQVPEISATYPPRWAPSSVAATHRAQHHDHQRRSERRDDERAEPAGRLVLPEQVDPQPAADEAAGDADQHGAQAAIALAAGHERTGDGAG